MLCCRWLHNPVIIENQIQLAGIYNYQLAINMAVVFEYEPVQISHGLFSTKVKNRKTGRSRKLKNWESDVWMIFNNTLEKAGVPVCYSVSNQDQLPKPVYDAYREFCEAFVPEATEARYLAFYQLMTGSDYNVHNYAQDIISSVRREKSPNPLEGLKKGERRLFSLRDSEKDLTFNDDKAAFTYACEYLLNDYLAGPCTGVVIQKKEDGDYIVKIANQRDKSIPQSVDVNFVADNADIYCVAASPIIPMNYNNGDLVQVDFPDKIREMAIGPLAGIFHKIDPVFNTDKGWKNSHV